MILRVFCQRNKKMKIYLLGIIIFFQIGNIYAQNQISFEEIKFEQFLKTKLVNDSNFVKIIYQNLFYTKEARERLAEEKIEILLQFELNRKFKLIQLNQNDNFSRQIQKLEKLFNELELTETNPFITRFFIYFEIIPFRYSDKDFENLYFELVDNNTFVVRGYIAPKINKKNKN